MKYILSISGMVVFGDSKTNFLAFNSMLVRWRGKSPHFTMSCRFIIFFVTRFVTILNPCSTKYEKGKANYKVAWSQHSVSQSPLLKLDLKVSLVKSSINSSWIWTSALLIFTKWFMTHLEKSRDEIFSKCLEKSLCKDSRCWQ